MKDLYFYTGLFLIGYMWYICYGMPNLYFRINVNAI